MALTLLFNDVLLSSSIDKRGRNTARVNLQSGEVITVSFTPRMRIPPQRVRTRRAAALNGGSHFSTRLGGLPDDAQAWLRQTANKIQKQIYDDTPDFIYPRGGGLLPTRDHRGRTVNSRGKVIHIPPRQPILVEKPPQSLELQDDLQVRIRTHATYNDGPCLKVGNKLEIVYEKGIRARYFVVGTIESFTLN